MAKSYESLLEYKKSTGDWHYDPSIPTADCTYVGQIIDSIASEKVVVRWDSEHDDDEIILLKSIEE